MLDVQDNTGQTQSGKGRVPQRNCVTTRLILQTVSLKNTRPDVFINSSNMLVHD